jgi:oxygen-dependent protoporphyrinogen oxidase
MSRIAIVGGGITGLSAAWTLQQQHIPYVVIESSAQLGGKIQTEVIPHTDGTAFIIDGGPESFVTRKPEVWELAHALGIGDQLVAPGSETAGIYILYAGSLYPVPLSLGAFITSHLLSPLGKLRLLAEPFITPRRDTADETLAQFAQRRLGREVMERMVGPILGGIYNADPYQQSVLVSAPQMRNLERDYGGLVRGQIGVMWRQHKIQAEKRPRFVTFRDGAAVLVAALQQRLTGDVYLNTRIQSIQRAGAGYTLHTADGTALSATGVILATPANVAAKLVEPLAPPAAALLAAIPHVPIGTVTLVFKTTDLPPNQNISSLMIPRREQRAIDAVVWTSQRMTWRVPAGYALLKVFIGGARPDMVAWEDAPLLKLVLAELNTFFGINAQPVLYRIFRWHDSYPQAPVGHLERVAHIEQALPPGIFVTGSSYAGVGVPDCIRQGQHTATLAAALGQSTTL